MNLQRFSILVLYAIFAFNPAYGQSAAATKPVPYSDTNVVTKYRALGETPTQDQLNQLANDIKANGINFSWTGTEVTELQTNEDIKLSVGDTAAIQKVLQRAGFIKDPTVLKGDSFALLFFGGARLENPYSITTDPTKSTGTLTTGNKQTDGFLEIDLLARSIFRTGDFDDKFCQEHPTKLHWFYQEADGTTTPKSFCEGLLPFGNFYPDYDLKLGYTFSGSSAPTNFNVSTIAQGSDFYLDSSIGLPVFRYNNQVGLKAQGSLEFGGGFTTDKNFLLIHPTMFVGGGLQLAAHLMSPTNDIGTLYILSRVGMAMVDTPRLTAGTTVALDSLQRPIFDSKWAPSIGATALFKLNSSTAFQLGANAYFTDIPSWNLTAGISIDPTKFFK